MRVLFTTTPGWGHVHPMVPLARAFAERGDEVLWAAPAGLRDALERVGFRVEAAGIAFGEGPPPFDPRELMALPARERSTVIFPRVFGGALVPPMLADLLPIVKRFEPDVIVHEVAEFAAAIAAAAAGVPSVTHSLGALMPPERMAAIGEHVDGLWEELGLSPRPYAGSYADLYIDICPPSLQSADMSHVPFIAPLRPVTFASEGEEELPSWPAQCAEDPLVYVTFGTTLAARAAPTATVLEAVRELPVRLLLTVGPQGDPGQFGDQPPNVRIARYIPQTAVLGSCAAVVSHAGSGTMFAALARGIPNVCLPQAADQFQNAEACVRVGAGFAFEPGEVTAPELRAAVEQLLNEPGPRAAAAKLSREISEMPDPGEVAQTIATRFAGGAYG